MMASQNTYRGQTFELTENAVTDRPGNGLPERTARIINDALILEGPDEKRYIRREELPTDGPRLESTFHVLDWAFGLARRDIESNFFDGGMYAGKNFHSSSTSTWVRDSSYSVMMGLGLFYPKKVRSVLAGLLDEATGRIAPEQYQGVYEDRFFTMTDNIVWVLAAQYLAEVTGEASLIRRGAGYALSTIDRMLRERFDPASGLFAGNSSFFDGHTGFPSGMTGLLLRSLSTNLLYVRAADLLAGLDGLDPGVRANLMKLSKQVRDAIETELWVESRRFYAQFHHGENYREERCELLAHALAAADPAISDVRAEVILAAIPRTAFGPAAIMPAYHHRLPYHTEAGWPFLWGMLLRAVNRRERCAGAAVPENSGGADVTHLAGELLRSAMLEGTFMELIESATGRGIYSERQLWSASAMLSLVSDSIFGMQFHDDELRFAPHPPAFLVGHTITLHDLPLRGREVTLKLDGDGTVFVDGQPLAENRMPLPAPANTEPQPIVIPSNLSLDIPEALPREAAASLDQAEGLTLTLSPGCQVIWPADEQVGSYALTVRVRNDNSEPRLLRLQCACDGPGLYVQPEELTAELAPNDEQTCVIRLGFDSPPVLLGRATLTVAAADVPLTVTAKIRRVLTLDGSWRFKPMFKSASHEFSRNLDEYDSWGFLRTPMPMENRLGPYTGVLWLAKRFYVPADWEGRDLIFYCGGMCEQDITWFNGTEIGRTGSPESPATGAARQYHVPAKIVRFGERNSISIKTFCNGENVGVTKLPLFLSPTDEFDWAKEITTGIAQFNRDSIEK